MRAYWHTKRWHQSIFFAAILFCVDNSARDNEPSETERICDCDDAILAQLYTLC